MSHEFQCKSCPNGIYVITKSILTKDAKFRHIIDAMGHASAIAQKLPTVITTFEKVMKSEDHRVYVAVQDEAAIGILKTGRKALFISDEIGSIHEINPLACLDFYVAERVQRQGAGSALFEFMLAQEETTAEQLAYDRPSAMLLAFLNKNYKLHRFTPQANNFVVFHDYFEGAAARGNSRAKEYRTATHRPLSPSGRRRTGSAGVRSSAVTGPGVVSKPAWSSGVGVASILSGGESKAEAKDRKHSPILSRATLIDDRRSEEEARSLARRRCEEESGLAVSSAFRSTGMAVVRPVTETPVRSSPSPGLTGPAYIRKYGTLNVMASPAPGSAPLGSPERFASEAAAARARLGGLASSYGSTRSEPKSTREIDDMSADRRDKFMFTPTTIRRPF